MRRPERGFTLIEVMAAVAVVAIVFSTLARVASQGLQSEGTSKRRFEASLLADAALVEIEAQLADGIAPEIGSSEFEEGLFEVVVDVTAFDLSSVIPVGAFTTENSPDAGMAPPALLGGPDQTPLREITIAVSWTEGVNELRVTRTTFGIDLLAMQELESAGGGAPPSPGTVPR
jgi:prepilin-type N-terminal cleavage/methylation domain-containing protein